MGESIGKVCKGAGILLFVVGGIGGVVYWIAFQSFLALLYIWLGAFLSGLLFLAAGALLSLLQDIRDSASLSNQLLQRMLTHSKGEEDRSSPIFKSPTPAPVHKTPQTPPVTRASVTGNTWTCPKCGEKNRAADRSCKSCGAYR
mgnify:CR=1 FL=1